MQQMTLRKVPKASKHDRRISIAPLLEYINQNLPEDEQNHYNASRVLMVHRKQLYRWLHTGVTIYQADELANRVHAHPFTIWPEWYELTLRKDGHE